MLHYTATDDMLVDYITKEHQGNLDLHVSEDQCAYLQLSDGRKGFFRPGDHTIRMDSYSRPSNQHENIQMYWFNLSNHIVLHLSDTVSVMEQMLKTVDPGLKLYAPVRVCVATDLIVRIANPAKLLKLLFARQAGDSRPVLDRQWLSAFLEEKLHYILEDSLNNCKQQAATSLSRISELTESLEIAMIYDICDSLEALSLELVAAHITHILPTRESILAFQAKEAETLAWYNQVQMDRFIGGMKSSRTQTSRTQKSRTQKNRSQKNRTQSCQTPERNLQESISILSLCG